MVSLRRSPSGKRFSVVDIPDCQEISGYSAVDPLDITLVEAGHEPGLYLPFIDVIVRVVSVGVGSLIRNISYDAPNFGTTNVLLGQVALTVTGHAAQSGAGSNQLFYVPNPLRSTGLSPIILTLQPNAIVGTPAVDIYASASLIALPP